MTKKRLLKDNKLRQALQWGVLLRRDSNSNSPHSIENYRTVTVSKLGYRTAHVAIWRMIPYHKFTMQKEQSKNISSKVQLSCFYINLKRVLLFCILRSDTISVQCWPLLGVSTFYIDSLIEKNRVLLLCYVNITNGAWWLDLVCGTVFRSSCAIQTSPADCLHDSWRDIFFGKAWTWHCDLDKWRLRKTLIYLLTYVVGGVAQWQVKAGMVFLAG